jgi:hypothetical protein
VGFAELGLGAHTEVVTLPSDAATVAADTPVTVVLTRLRTDPLNRWRSDPEPRMVRQFTARLRSRLTARIALRRNDRASDELLNTLSGVTTPSRIAA